MSTGTVTSAPPERKPKNLSGKIYQAVWRWHFWAGLVAAPFLIIMSVTGALYVFEDELSPILYPELYTVESRSETVTLERMKADIEAALPEYEVHNFTFPEERDRSWFSFVERENETGEHEHRWVYYDPYKGEILGHHSSSDGFFRVVLNIHRTLLAGTIGRYLTEAATCWGIISMLAGLYLWWPRKTEKVRGVWIPRTKGGFRTTLRDWHTVPSFYVSIFVLLIMFTGLLFTSIWGRAYLIGNALTGGFPEFYVSPPKSADSPESAVPLSLDSALATATEAFPGFAKGGFSIDLPHASTQEAISVISDITKPLSPIGAVFIDNYTGKMLSVDTSEDFPLRTHLTLLFYPIHTGSIFGLGTKVLAVVSCLLIVAMSVTGVWMWWRRRPRGKIGAPRKPAPRTIPRWIAWLTVALAIFLPTVGLTLILIGIASWIGKTIRPAPAT